MYIYLKVYLSWKIRKRVFLFYLKMFFFLTDARFSKKSDFDADQNCRMDVEKKDSQIFIQIYTTDCYNTSISLSFQHSMIFFMQGKRYKNMLISGYYANSINHKLRPPPLIILIFFFLLLPLYL